ncbi:uncharacterized protein LOC100908309 [Galendromus occidentalis]|uniref:Uncharacterized protein LOC100908309 n=1 Tax=Galendromus occidentalis TaxID=34638 RepID=A0AAJ7WH82_9ACAR|nr:uncharacterized protein LOC100908309 [Galendromus occidentalis]
MVCHREGRSPILGTSPTDITSACQSAPCAGSLGTLLQTAYVWVVNGSEKIICRAILDPGSQRSFVSNKIVKLLNLKPVAQVDLKVHGIAGQVSNNLMNIVQLRLQSRFSDQHIVIGCLQVPTVIEGQIPRAVCPSDLSPLADSREPDFSDVIDVLIGADALHSVYCGMYRRAGEYTASPTIFGWVLWGNGGSNVYTNSVITSCGILQDSMSKSNDLAVYAPSRAKNHSDDLEFLWKTEVLGIENSEANDNRSSLEAMEKFFKDTIKLSPEGRLIVSLPFRENKHTLGDNQKLAYSRLMGLLKNLKKKPTVAKKSLNKEEKIRLVKDGGARSKDEASLNDVLEKGPNYLPDLITVLIQFRRSPIVIVADIKSAFNQFLIDEKHRTFLRFYWPAGISQNPNAPVLEYWAKVLDFGLVCSPWLHCAGVRHHLDLQMVKRPRHADLLAEIKRTFYMDDLAVGCSSLNQGKRLVEFLIEVFREGHFPLGKWKTNSKELASFIEKITSDDKPEISFENPKAKFLGVSWNQKEDVLFIDTTDTASFFRNNPPTKRNLLKALSQIYDPLGIIASISINFKILTQTLWTRKIDWDAILDPETASEYRRIAGFLDGSDRIAIRRNMFGTASGGSRREIHVFADSSLKAYGAIAYLKETNVNSPSDKCSVSFLMAKARVAPLKGHWTIHRLELMAAVIASRMANHLRNSIPEKIDEIFLYSDNSAVLGWLRSSPEKWKPFVANRVKEILGYSSPDRWSYIQSEENPADLLSRGSALETDSLKQFWLEGPSWLRDNRSQRSHVLNAPSESEEMLREKKVEITAAVASRVQDESTFSSKFSSWAKLVRVTAFMRRWLPKNRNKFKSGDNSITPEEFMEAEIAVVKTIQRQHFAAELDAGASNLSKASALKTLNPFVDDSGILRCRSRLEKSSNINYEVKFPVILPVKDSLVQLLIRSIHETQCLHSGGTAGALHALRQRFLILSARREVNRAIHGCKVCARFKAKAAAEPMPPLPAFRIEESPPFAVTGVDHAGPIYIKNAAGEKTKSYILLFVCAVTRALRLELVADLSTYEFLLALRRFMSRNPSVKHIISDNARTFLKAEKELKSLFEKAKHPDCQSLLSKKGMKWSHSTERAPWHGAFWERLVQVVKRPLRKILGIHALPFRETETLLFEIEKWSTTGRFQPSWSIPMSLEHCPPHACYTDTLANRPFRTQKRIAQLVQQIRESFGLPTSKITTCVTDNGSNFIKAFAEFGVDAAVLDRDEVEPRNNDEAHELSEDEVEGGDSDGGESGTTDNSEELEDGSDLNDEEAGGSSSQAEEADVERVLNINRELALRHEIAMAKWNILWKLSRLPKT